jgi:hypothetical protein
MAEFDEGALPGCQTDRQERGKLAKSLSFQCLAGESVINELVLETYQCCPFGAVVFHSILQAQHPGNPYSSLDLADSWWLKQSCGTASMYDVLEESDLIRI